MKNKYSKDFILRIPKTDLHVHLDGSLRLKTLISLAKGNGVKLPSYTESGLKEKVFKNRYKNLVEYLTCFNYTTAVMQNAESLEVVAYELAMDSFNEGVRYIEPRFAPQLHSSPSFPVHEVIAAVNKGLERAKKEINSKKDVKSGKEPPFEYSIICCALRMFSDKFPGAYGDMVDLHPHMPKDELYGFASLDLVRSMVFARDNLGIPVMGFDLAGAEKGYPAEDHKAAFDLAHKYFFRKTVHAGEAFGPESIFQAITDCHSDRIGHGTHIFDANMVNLSTKREREKYVRSLLKYIADGRTTIEVCLTSNLQTMPALKNILNHPVTKMLNERLSITFCTDNRLVSNTTVTDEIDLATKNIDLIPKKLKDIIIYGFKRSFFPGNYVQKRRYVRQIIDHYERVEKEVVN